MLADLFRNKRFLDKQNSEVFKALGESTHYCSYDDQPCYLIKMNDIDYVLDFGVLHDDAKGEVGSVIGIRLYKL